MKGEKTMYSQHFRRAGRRRRRPAAVVDMLRAVRAMRETARATGLRLSTKPPPAWPAEGQP